MENRTVGVFLNRALRVAAVLALLAPAASVRADDAPAAADDAPVDPLAASVDAPLIEPEVARRDVREAKIDSENVEVGVYGGIFSIEDFGTAPHVGAMVAWHFTEDLFLQGNVYRTKAGLTSYEVLSGNARLLTAAERELTGYDLSVGYNLFPGEAFMGRKRAFNTAFYLLAGMGSTHFGGEDRFTLSVGVGYRLLPTDWLSWHIGFRDHVFASDITGEDKNTHNIEMQTGVATFF